MSFYTSEQILNQAFDSASQSLKTGGGGAAGTPSTDVVSVQGPPNQFGTITFTGNTQYLTLKCEGMASATFFCRLGGTLNCQVSLDYGNGIWQPAEVFIHTAAAVAATVQYTGFTPLINNWYMCNTRGAKQVRIGTTSWTSGGVVDGVVSPTPLSMNVEISGIATNATLPVVGTVSQIITPSSCSIYYTDTTTPLAANATFTGSSRTMAVGNNAFNAIFSSDANGAALGAQIQNSPDAGTNWRGASPANALTGDVALVHRAPRTLPTYRVIYANGGTAQTYFCITSSQTPN